MAEKETLKDYLNKCQILQREAVFDTFSIHVFFLGFEVNLSIIDKDLLIHKYSFRFNKHSRERELEDEYRLLLSILETNKYGNDFIQN